MQHPQAQLERIPNDPDPDESPGVITLQRVQAITAKDPVDWTDAERAYMAHGLEWANDCARVFVEALTPAVEAFVDALAEVGRRMASAIAPISIDLREAMEAAVAESNEEWLPNDMAPHDQFRHVAGLPGISARCWADRWDEEAQEYHPCNAEAGENDMGLCDDDMARMRGNDAETGPGQG